MIDTLKKKIFQVVDLLTTFAYGDSILISGSLFVHLYVLILA